MTTRRRTLAAVLTAAVLTAVVAAVAASGAVGAVRRRGHHGAPIPPPLGADVAAVIPELEAFVESVRGLKFLTPVKVAVVGDAEFRRRYDAGGSPTDAVDPRVQARVLRALGLLGPHEDLSAGGGPDADSVAGYYDSDTKDLVVRGARPTPFVRQVLVHELTHALDDQHFGLGQKTADGDAGLAFDALSEGDAMVVEDRYFRSLSAAEQKESTDEEDSSPAGGGPGGRGGGEPDVLAALDDFPYSDGPGLVDALLAAGGQARLDAAFLAPPATTAEVLHPARYLAGTRSVAVPAPATDGGARVIDAAPLGELLLRLVLAETLGDGAAERAATGWAGDRYVAWQAGRRTCVRDAIAVGSAAEGAELLSALQAWAADHRGATVEATPVPTLTRCA